MASWLLLTWYWILNAVAYTYIFSCHFLQWNWVEHRSSGSSGVYFDSFPCLIQTISIYIRITLLGSSCSISMALYVILGLRLWVLAPWRFHYEMNPGLSKSRCKFCTSLLANLHPCILQLWHWCSWHQPPEQTYILLTWFMNVEKLISDKSTHGLICSHHGHPRTEQRSLNGQQQVLGPPWDLTLIRWFYQIQ